MNRYQTKLKDLCDGTLDAADFTHKDHIGVAFEALKQHDFFTALGHVSRGIETAALRAGATDKFNATITLAYMSEIAEQMEFVTYVDADALMDANPQLIKGGPLKRYSPGRATSKLARRTALLPDLPAVSAPRTSK
ncbi:MAG: hypothetical protein GJ676_09855 [Rhodobacteraceae bacterium]|nr:hypothetical protein [Paracoccaceae bacterium]